MRTDKHYDRLNESLEVLDESIAKNLTSRQRTIGFNCSAAAVDMLEIYLHNNSMIDSGFILKHEWFASRNKIKDKLPFDFKEKAEILELMRFIEVKRNDLCYGTPKAEEEIKAVLIKFNQLKEMLKNIGVKIEQ